MNKQQFLERYEDLGWTYVKPNVTQALRINTLLIKENELLKRLEEKGVLLKKAKQTNHGYFIEHAPFKLSSTLEYLKGFFFMQDASAQKAAELLDPKPNDKVLDMCAAPGAKTTHLAQIMQNKGVIVGTELKKERLIGLKNNLERCNVKNTLIYNMNAKDAPKLNMQFDKILLDAPCSGNFTQDKDWFAKRDLAGITRNANLQRQLLKAAFYDLKKEGEIVYATCSLEPEENEENCSWFQQELPVKMTHFERIWPEQTTGFFMAKFKKVDDS